MDFCLAMPNFIGFSAFLHSAFSLHHFPIGFTGPTLALLSQAENLTHRTATGLCLLI
jgi:hypothetical protein